MSTYGCTTDRDVVRVAGPEAESYLQGQLSQDLDALAVNTSTWTFVLQPQGKVDTWARITKTASDCFLLDTDPGAGAGLHERLSRFLLRTKADVDQLELPAIAVRGPDAPHGELPDGVLRLPLVGPGVEGYDLLGEGATIPDGVEEGDEARLEADRIEHGVPRMGRELTHSTIPAEVGQWIIDESVSFTKGCFVGQELVARIDSRGGNVPKTLRALVLDLPVEPGATVTADGPASAVTSAAVSEHLGPIALAFLGRKVEPGVGVVVGETHGVVHELPLVMAGED
ncbi:MAG: hypothetical protein U5K30_00840 [Acidimicrobiales bacterium]|nr:hypothetical protein [Acidimicrobiales bacterium]